MCGHLIVIVTLIVSVELLNLCSASIQRPNIFNNIRSEFEEEASNHYCHRKCQCLASGASIL